MSDHESRFATWTELVAHLLMTGETYGFPREPVELLLLATFGGVVSFNWRERDGSFGFDLLGDDSPAFVRPESIEAWQRRGLDDHPLLRWFAHSGDTTPMTVGRVPRQLVPVESFATLREELAPYGCEEQLSMPFRLDGLEHRAYVLARGEEDWSDEDLALAVRIQPLLRLLDEQVRVLGDRRDLVSGDLTGRELAVLELLAQGLTAIAIAHRLGSSVRTVQKHLEHSYRKLGVRDRLMAVQVAREGGLLTALVEGPAPTRACSVLVSQAGTVVRA